MLQSIYNMRTLAELCRSHEPLPEPLACWLATSLQSFLDCRCASLNEAFGVRNPRGGVTWRVEASIRIRDAALRSLATNYYADLSVSAQSDRIHKLASRYAAASWRFDRERHEMPFFYRGTPQECLWEAFKSGAIMPLGGRQLRTILNA
jgi:hypothetical protein